MFRFYVRFRRCMAMSFCNSLTCFYKLQELRQISSVWKKVNGEIVSSRWWFQNCHPCLGKWSNLTNIFQMGWNHHLVKSYFFLLNEHRNRKNLPFSIWIFLGRELISIWTNPLFRAPPCRKECLPRTRSPPFHGPDKEVLAKIRPAERVSNPAFPEEVSKIGCHSYINPCFLHPSSKKHT